MHALSRLMCLMLSAWAFSLPAMAQNAPAPLWTYDSTLAQKDQAGFILIDEAQQMLWLYVDGRIAGQSSVSTGRADYPTPLGDFTVLERDIDHRSNLYEDAPMPYMLRLTWSGVALHGGYVPGYPASHGCVRLPEEFAKKLYARTRLGTAVSVVRGPFSQASLPTDFLAPPAGEDVDLRGTELAYRLVRYVNGSGPVVVHVHLGTKRLEILRQGREVGRADLAITGSVRGKYYLQYGQDSQGQLGWQNLIASEQASASADVRIDIHPAVRTVLSQLVKAGAVLIVSGQDQPE